MSAVASAPVFTQDWSHTRNCWDGMFAEFGWAHRPSRFLEIGCYEGQATLWMLDAAPACHVTVIDTFEGSPEFAVMGVDQDFESRFLANVEPYADRVTVLKGTSVSQLLGLDDRFDLVYVDGSHTAADVHADARLAWPLLNVGGVMVFDDYAWNSWDGVTALPAKDTPGPGIDRFVREHTHDATVRLVAYQLVLEKKR